MTSRGANRVFINHPFKLKFLDYEWSMVHNGTARRYESLVPFEERLLTESDNDSARVFEFLRRKVIDYYLRDHGKSLIEGCRAAYGDLLRVSSGGKFNIILSNGDISFLFIHFRCFIFLTGRKKGALLCWHPR